MATNIKALVMPTTAPQALINFVNPETGVLTPHGKQFIQQHYNQTTGANRFLPCNGDSNGNHYILTMQVPRQNVYQSYATHDSFGFVAPATSTGLVTAHVITTSGALAAIPVYKNNGAAQANAGDIVNNLHYMFTYVDSLNGGNGGFVVR